MLPLPFERVRDYYELTDLGRVRRLRGAVAAALENYELDVARVGLISNETNGIFRVDTDRGPYAVRVGLGGGVGHTTAETRAEVAWLDALSADPDIDVAIPVPTRSGDLFTTVEVPGLPGPRNVTVFTWLPGPVLADRLHDDSVREFGALSARLHRHGAQFCPPAVDLLPRYDRVIPFREPDHVSDASASLFGPDRAERFCSAARRVRSAIDRLDPAGAQTLHGDLHHRNVKFHRGRLAAFDFEDLMIGWPVQDVATTLYYFHGTPDFAQRSEVFRQGYESVLPWPARSSSEITDFLIGRALVLANFTIVSPELDADRWFERFDRRIAALVDGRDFRIET